MAGGKELKLAISIGGKIDKSLGSAINNAQSQLNSISAGVSRAAGAITIATAAAGAKLVSDSIEAYQQTSGVSSTYGVTQILTIPIIGKLYVRFITGTSAYGEWIDLTAIASGWN